MQSTCPRSFLPPLQVGLSVTLEHKYGHCVLVDMISKHDFCSSYAEANKYRTNAAAVQRVDLPEEVTRSFLQYQADNVDHASRTLDGHGSVHVMGQIATFTPAINNTRQIPRLKVDMEVVKHLAKVNLVEQKDPKSVQSEILYKRVEVFQHDMYNDNLDIMWAVSFHLPQPKPMWSGYMQMLHHNMPHPGRTSDIFLPTIDLALLVSASEANEQNMSIQVHDMICKTGWMSVKMSVQLVVYVCNHMCLDLVTSSALIQIH